jgi:DegV family protein with EDD domain
VRVRIVTNPGSNLSEAEVAHFNFFITPQQIVVDGAHHDTRKPIPLTTIDRWARNAKEHPYVLGTSAAECSELFRQLATTDKRIVMMTTSRQIIGTYTAATAAARSFMAASPDVAIDVVDTATTDLGAGMVTIFAGEAALAGKPQLEVVALAERFASGGHLRFHVDDIEYLVKGGRASFIRAWLAEVLKVTPILGFARGELKALGRVPRDTEPVPVLIEQLKKAVTPGRSVWAAVVHGGNESRATRAVEAVRATWNVERLYLRTLSPSIYLHAGPGSAGAFVYPVDTMPWRPEAMRGDL